MGGVSRRRPYHPAGWFEVVVQGRDGIAKAVKKKDILFGNVCTAKPVGPLSQEFTGFNYSF